MFSEWWFTHQLPCLPDKQERMPHMYVPMPAFSEKVLTINRLFWTAPQLLSTLSGLTMK